MHGEEMCKVNCAPYPLIALLKAISFGYVGVRRVQLVRFAIFPAATFSSSNSSGLAVSGEGAAIVSRLSLVISPGVGGSTRLVLLLVDLFPI